MRYNSRMMNGSRDVEKTALAITRAVGSPLSVVIHTVIFIASFAAVTFGLLDFDRMLLVLTTIVSLEAIYLAIFIQMTINYTTHRIKEVAQDVEEIQEDVGEIQEDVGELQEDIEEIGEGVEEMSVDEASEEAAEEARKSEQKQTLDAIHSHLQKLIEDVERLKSART